MAQKTANGQADAGAQAPASELSPAEQLQAISPELRVTIAGRELVMREYGYFEGLEVAHRAAGFIAAMHALCSDGQLRFDRIRRLFGVHEAAVVVVAAQAADVDPAWVRGLSREDSETFMSAWFGVNAGFFVHEVVVEMREDRQRALLGSIGSSSSSASPSPDAATSPSSDASPSGS